MKTLAAGFACFLIAFSQPASCQTGAGEVDLSFDAGSSITRPVYAVATMGDGGAVIGGDFTTVNGAMRSGVARLQANGATDLLFVDGLAGLTTSCRSLLVQPDGKILIGGYFSDGWSSVGLVRLNDDGSWDETFPIPLRSYVYTLVRQNDGKILAGGSFAASGRRGVIRLNPDGTIDNTFLYGLSGVDSTVNAIVVQSDGRVIIGGQFSTVNGIAKSCIARLNPDGTLDAGFTATVTGGINSMVLQPDGKVVLVGNFNWVNGTALNRLARLNTDGTLDSSFANGLSGANAAVSVVKLQEDGKLLVGGSFTSIHGANQSGLARLNSTGTRDTSFSVGSGGVSGSVQCLAMREDGLWFVGGSFSQIGTVPRKNIARLGSDGALDNTFLNGTIYFTGPVSCIATQTDGKMLVNGVAGTGIGRLNTNGAPDATFLAGLSGANGAVNAIAVQQSGKILIAGQFAAVNGSSCRALARLTSNGALDTGFLNGIGGTAGEINCLAVQSNGRILVGGVFDSVKNVGRNNLARLNADGSVDTAFLNGLEGVNGPVYSLAVQPDGKILLGGNFTAVNGMPRSSLARLNIDGTLDLSFQDGMDGPSGSVYTIVVQPDSRILIGGWFQSVNNIPAYHIARLAVDGSLDDTFDAGQVWTFLYGIRAIALQSDGRILVGGEFDEIEGVLLNNIARLRTNGVVEAFLQSPLGTDGPVLALTLADQNRVLVGGAFSSLSGAPRSYVARMIYQVPSVPLGDALNNTSLAWTNDALSPWEGQGSIAHDLVASAQSGPISDDQETSLRTSVVGPGCLSFWWKVSSEAYFDFLTFTSSNETITNKVAISGDVDWNQQIICLPPGVHKLQWTYSKDWSVSVGRDAGWVDEVIFTPGYSAPIIMANPVSRTNFAGEGVSFTAMVAGSSPLRYQWQLNGNDIPQATNLTYFISGVLPEQGGTYRLKVTNPYGVAYTANAYLTVIPIRVFGRNDYGQTNVTLATVDTVAISAGQLHNLVLRRDGSIYAWGNNSSRQCEVPVGVAPAFGIAAGGYHSLAIKADGSVVGWGDNSYGQAAPPSGLDNVIAVSAGMWHSMALRADGTVMCWGDNGWIQSNVPVGATNIVAVAAGGSHSLALRADGMVLGWGGNMDSGGSYVGQAAVPWDLNRVVAIGAGEYHSLAVKSDGSIVGWGANNYGQSTPPTNLPPATAVSAGGTHSLALFGDGTAAAWGDNFDGQCNLSRALSNVVAVAAGSAHSLVLLGTRPPPPVVGSPSHSGQQFSVQVLTYPGKLYCLEYKNSLSAVNWTALPMVRGAGGVQALTDPGASVSQRYYRVRQW